MMHGSIYSMNRLQMLNAKWEARKKSLDEMRPQTQIERQINEAQRQMAEIGQSNEEAQLYNKILSGKKLTPDEEAYLRTHNPGAYQDYKEVQMEKESYAKELRNCKTKDEVERVKSNRIGKYLSMAKKTFNNPAISDGAKVAMAKKMMAMIKVTHDVEVEFKRSEGYKKLPTEVEVMEAKEEEREAKEVLITEEEPSEEEQIEIPPEEVEASKGTEEESGSKDVANTIQTQKDVDIQMEADIDKDYVDALRTISDMWNNNRPVGKGYEYFNSQDLENNLKISD